METLDEARQALNKFIERHDTRWLLEGTGSATPAHARPSFSRLAV